MEALYSFFREVKATLECIIILVIFVFIGKIILPIIIDLLSAIVLIIAIIVGLGVIVKLIAMLFN